MRPPAVSANSNYQNRSTVSHNENYHSHQSFQHSIRLSSPAGDQINAFQAAKNIRAIAFNSSYYGNGDDDDESGINRCRKSSIDHFDDGYKSSQFQLVDLSTSPPSDTYSSSIFNKPNSQSIPPLRHNFHYRRQQTSADITSPTTSSSNFYSATNSFDENFVALSRAQSVAYDLENHLPFSYTSDSPIRPKTVNLPQSETEPLLTNIDAATITDPERSIYLNKNSASLIFTKKDCSSSTASYHRRSSCNSSSPSHDRHNSNADRTKDYKTNTPASGSQSRGRNRNHSLKNANDYRKQQQQQQNQYPQPHHHHHQQESAPLNQHRRSLPVNYINSVNGYTNNFNHIDPEISQNNCNQVSFNSNGFAVGTHRLASNTTAATVRKQHAYSWYAPVYSALEEELEQDSRDSSPIHKLANAKKHLSSTKNHHHHHHQGASSVDNETVSLLESKNQINIQPQLHRQSRNISSPPQQPPSTLHLTNSHNSSFIAGAGVVGVGGSGAVASSANKQQQQQQYDVEGPHAGSLLAGGPIPRRRRIENFFKSLVGGRKSSSSSGKTDTQIGRGNSSAATVAPLLPSPEITITRTPSDQNVLDEDSNETYRRSSSLFSTSDKIALTPPAVGSTTSLNMVQQKLWNVVPLLRRERSASSLHNEKSQSIVQYTGLRKCETVLALTRQSSSICSPVFGMGPNIIGGSAADGSGIFSASGVEQIRPLNRLRNSLSTSNATCSRCSSLLSLGVSGSRYSLNITNSALINNISNNNSASGGSDLQTTPHPNHYNHHHHHHQLQQQHQNNYHQQNHHHHHTTNHNSIISSSNSVRSDLQNGNILENAGGSCSRKSSAGANSNHSASISSSGNSPPSNVTTATLNSSTLSSTPSTPTATVLGEVASACCPATVTSLLSISPSSLSVSTASQQNLEIFTCKLCLLDVSVSEATTIGLCGCRFCTECMKAYVDFEICEAAYEISCPDAQCPAQGIIALQEIAKLTSANLMKKHHRYRLNREIELDKSRTWCPRAGCETVCLVGVGPGTSQDAATISADAASTSLASNLGISPVSVIDKDDYGTTQYLCAVQCPSCKDEFCSACKKTWHPNLTCEENSRRLVADGQDDIGIPFDNDLIKCCPMCAVPIEKDEGCAQMMCKRCKHVFCWYCLASLDDDFLLRHYDKGPCKNKLGHSRASVVWHRAQVIGIFAGFGILLLVASPLLLLAAPCIICCKCRICSGGNKMEDPEADIEEAAALHS